MSKKERITEEENWRAEEDSRTLIEYQKIKEDEKRFNKAVEKLKQKEKEVNQAVKALK